MIISGSVGSQGGPYNDLYYDDANTTYFINGIRPYTDQQVGDLVNMTGFTSGTHAGKQILAYNFNWQISYGGNVYTLTGDKVASAMAGGDSGGPVYYTGNAYGMTDAIGSNFTVYVWAGFQASDLGVNICVTSSC